MVCGGWKFGDWSRRHEEKFVLGEQGVHAVAKYFMALAQGGYGIVAEAGAPLEAFADGGFEVREMTAVVACRFAGLDWREDLAGIRPPVA